MGKIGSSAGLGQLYNGLLEDSEGAPADELVLLSFDITMLRFSARVARKSGFGHLRQRRMADAVQSFREAVDCDPENSQGWRGLAFCYLKLRNLDGAEFAYSKAVSLTKQEGREGFAQSLTRQMTAISVAREAHESPTFG
jgi:tetratricopeptide (TPR) repeat protein